MKSQNNQPPHLAILLAGSSRKRASKTRRQEKHDMLLHFMSQLRQPQKRTKTTFLKSLLSVFL